MWTPCRKVFLPRESHRGEQSCGNRAAARRCPSRRNTFGPLQRTRAAGSGGRALRFEAVWNEAPAAAARAAPPGPALTIAGSSGSRAAAGFGSLAASVMAAAEQGHDGGQHNHLAHMWNSPIREMSRTSPLDCWLAWAGDGCSDASHRELRL